MPEIFQDALQFSVVALSSIFFLVDPFAAVPSFLAMTATDTPQQRRRTAKRAALTCFFVLSGFAAMGGFVFKLFGLTLPALEIGGGIILLLVGLEMLQAKRSATQESKPETDEGEQKEDPGILPLGVPMLAGPGAISTVMVLMGPHFIVWRAAPVFLAITVTCLLSYLVLAAADRVRKVLGETGIRIMMRLMGLLLTAIAVQFMINGLVHLKVLGK
ncbi:MAG: NAAT family transporter [Acidobacteriales bacterium]|nr:NAAT family transporter [Terriglobales bacterium]